MTIRWRGKHTIDNLQVREGVSMSDVTGGLAILLDLGAPTVEDAQLDDIHAAITMPDSEPLVVTTGITNPDIPRGIVINGNQAGITGNVVIVGTDIANQALTETIALNETTAVYGTKAFKTVTSITIPVKNGSGDTVVVGRGKIIGLPITLASANQVVFSTLGKAEVAAVLTVSSTVLASNTADLSGSTYDGSKRVALIVYKN